MKLIDLVGTSPSNESICFLYRYACATSMLPQLMCVCVGGKFVTLIEVHKECLCYITRIIFPSCLGLRET